MRKGRLTDDCEHRCTELNGKDLRTFCFYLELHGAVLQRVGQGSVPLRPRCPWDSESIRDRNLLLPCYNVHKYNLSKLLLSPINEL